MKLNLALAMATAAVACLMTDEQAQAFEVSPNQTTIGGLIGSSAAMPPPGIYMFDRVNTLQGNLAGPATKIIGSQTGIQSYTAAVGFLFVPGWSFLGATYDAVVVQAFQGLSLGSPINSQSSGMSNTYINPAELSWKLGDSGFYTKVGFGILLPDGTQTGANGLGNVGAPYWTFVPQMTLSYFKDGWNLTAAVKTEINTKNTVTGYTTGNILHADFTATKKINQWTFGPVAYYLAQISDDQSSAFYNYRIVNSNRYNRLGVGALVGYDFGPAALTVWGAQEVFANASGPSPLSGVPTGFFVNATLSYRLWAPNQDTSSPATRLVRK